MKPPPLKKARDSFGFTTDTIQETVEQALLSDDAGCEKLFRKLVGFEKEVVDAILVASKSENASKIYLRGPSCKFIREHFMLIGVSTTIERLKEFHSFIVDNVNIDYASNVASLLRILISCSHVLRHDKFRKEVYDHLPLTIKVLWKNDKIAEACSTARVLMEFLSSAKLYHEEDHSAEIWFGNTLSKFSGMRRHPYMAALSLLLDYSYSNNSNRIIELVTLQELPKHENKQICLRTQTTDLIITFLSSYACHCTNNQLQIFLEFVVWERVEDATLSSLINEIRKSTYALGDDSFIWDIVLESIIRVLARKLLSEGIVLDSINHHLSEALQTLFVSEANDKICSEAITESVHKYIDYGFKTKWDCSEILSSNEESLLKALFCIPIQSLSSLSIERYAIVAALFASRTHVTNMVLFSSSIRVLRLLLSISASPHLLSDLHVLDYSVFDSWCAALEGYTDASIIKDISVVLSSIIEFSCSKKSTKETYYLCPALRIFKGKDAECWSWTQIIRFSAVIMTTRWEALLKCSEPVQTEIAQKIREAYLAEMLHSIDWRNAAQMQVYADRWSIIFSCWDDIPRSSRQCMMKKLLSDDDIKSIRKFTGSIISGAFSLEKTVVERALMFQLKYLSFLYEGTRALVDVVDWNVLLYLQRVGISVDVVISVLSVDRVLELLAICSSELELTNDILAIVAKLVSARLKSVASACLELLAPIFDRAENCTQLLSCAANAIESFGHTDVERDVVLLCLSVASTQPLIDADFSHIRGMQKVIQNAMLYAHSAVNNDQCALLARLFVKVIKAVQRFVLNKHGTAEEVDTLVHASNTLAHTLTQHKMYYSRIVGSILSEIIKHSDKTELVVWKLCSISDKHSSSMLATNLPPAERLQYKRMFTAIKRAKKLIV